MEYIVGIGEYATSGRTGDVIKTFALATCVGLVYYSMRRRVMGMAHIQLPNGQNAGENNPTRYADLAPDFLMQEMMKKHGCTKGEILVSLYGGIDGRAQDCFRIGEKNLAIVRAKLKEIGLVYSDVDTGGKDSRTLVADVGTGIVEVIKRPMGTFSTTPKTTAQQTTPVSAVRTSYQPAGQQAGAAFQNAASLGKTISDILGKGTAKPAAGQAAKPDTAHPSRSTRPSFYKPVSFDARPSTSTAQTGGQAKWQVPSQSNRVVAPTKPWENKQAAWNGGKTPAALSGGYYRPTAFEAPKDPRAPGPKPGNNFPKKP
ncbi:chemotaxis protein CheD [Oscillospiraceae bacterium OttesenSCG-928-F05]|nr:chemotaxis protein CheD [Oscillospiraceae bacterium OttesenSCG-928-F05]